MNRLLSRGTVILGGGCSAAAALTMMMVTTTTPTTDGNYNLIARSQQSSSSDENATSKRKLALNPNEFVKLRLKSTEHVSPNTMRLRFELQSPEHETGLTVASCVVARAEIEGKTVTRPYTPISLNHQRGYMDLLVKSYPKPLGVMSRHIQSLRPGADALEFKGPYPKIQYKPNMKKKIGMIAGGTGITPMLQVIREILSNPEDRTQISLIFANVTEADILLKDELDALQYLYPEFKVYYTLDKPPRGWQGGVGYVSAEMIAKHLPTNKNNAAEDILILVCGPKGMMEMVSGMKGSKDAQGELTGLLKEMGFTSGQVYKF